MSERYLPYLKVPIPQEVKLGGGEYDTVTTISAGMNVYINSMEYEFVTGVKNSSFWNNKTNRVRRKAFSNRPPAAYLRAVRADRRRCSLQYRATITPNVGTASGLYWSYEFVGKMNDKTISSLNKMSERYLPYLKVPAADYRKQTNRRHRTRK